MLTRGKVNIMALVLTKYRLTVNFTETSGKAVRRQYEAPEADFADFAAFAAEVNTPVTGFLAQIAPLSDSEISSTLLEAVYIENALVLPAAAENQNEAFLSFKIDGDPTDSGNLSIPAASAGIFVAPTGPGHDIVDVQDIALLAWLNHFAPAGPFTVSDGEGLEISTLTGKRRNVKSNGT